MENQHPVDALFKELEGKGVRDNMSGGEWIEDDVAANWDFVKKLAKEQYQRFGTYKHMCLKDLHDEVGNRPDYYKQLLSNLSSEVYREEFTRSKKVNWYPLCGVFLGKTLVDSAVASKGLIKTHLGATLFLLSYPLMIPAYWAGYKVYNYFKRRRQKRKRPYVRDAFKVFGETTTSAFQAISNEYQDVLKDK